MKQILNEIRLFRPYPVAIRSYYYIFKKNLNLCKLYINYIHIH